MMIQCKMLARSLLVVVVLLLVTPARYIHVVTAAATAAATHAAPTRAHVPAVEPGSCVQRREQEGAYDCYNFAKMPEKIGQFLDKVLHMNVLRKTVGVTILDHDSLTPFPYLRSLDLGGNEITTVHVKALSGCQDLETLNLANNFITVSSLPRGLLKYSFLKTLTLTNNKQLGTELMAQETDNTRPPWLESRTLQKLVLAQCHLRQLPVWVVQGLPFLSKLDVSGNQLTTLDPLVPALLCRLTLLSSAGNPWDCAFCNNTPTLRILRNNGVQGLQDFCNSTVIKQSCDSLSNDTSVLLETASIKCLAVPEAQPPSPPMSLTTIVVLPVMGIIALVVLGASVWPLVSSCCHTSPATVMPPPVGEREGEGGYSVEKVSGGGVGGERESQMGNGVVEGKNGLQM